VSFNNEKEKTKWKRKRMREHSDQFPRIAPLITLELTERLLKVKATNEIRHMPGQKGKGKETG